MVLWLYLGSVPIIYRLGSFLKDKGMLDFMRKNLKIGPQKIMVLAVLDDGEAHFRACCL